MKLLTTGEIATQINVDRDKVSYAIRKLEIEPFAYAGQTRVFAESAVSQIERFVNSDSNKQA